MPHPAPKRQVKPAAKGPQRLTPADHPDALDMVALRNAGLLDELARVFNNDGAATEILDAIQYPIGQRPAWGAGAIPTVNWTNICNAVDTGLTEGGLEALIAFAAAYRPYNRLFRPWADRPTAQTDEETGATPPHNPVPAAAASSIFITGCRANPDAMLTAMQQIAQRMGVPGTVGIGGVTDRGHLVLDLSHGTVQQGLDMVAAYQQQQQGGAADLHMNVATNGTRATWIENLFVEGPDQARFELTKVPPQTPTRDIGRAIMGQYKDQGVAGGAADAQRNVTVDQLEPDGTTRRLQPDKSIAENGIRDGDTLHVGPESTAGNLAAGARDDALARVLIQMKSYRSSHPGFTIKANATKAPTEYTLEFQAPSFAPPPEKNAAPVRIDNHRVFVRLPPDFPMKAPHAFWQTPIFHPNIQAEVGFVCMDELSVRWRPATNFEHLCQYFVDVASFQIYNLQHGNHDEALAWARSAAGQQAIVSIGGRSKLEEYLQSLKDQLASPPQLNIRRIDKP